MSTPRSVQSGNTAFRAEPVSEVLAKYLPLLTEDAVVELHGMPPELPTRLVGHEDIRAAAARLAGRDLRITGLADAEPLLDPETWLVFAHGELVDTAGGRRRDGYVFALRLRGGRIAHCACYRDPLAVQAPAAAPQRGRLSPLANLGFGLRRRRRGQAPTDRLR